jgi:hypothetical protein
MSSVIAQYIPDRQATYRFARILGCHAILSVSVLQQLAVYLGFSLIATISTSFLMGKPLSAIFLWPLLIILLKVGFVFCLGMLSWRLFRIWHMKPDKSDDAPTELVISKIKNGIHLASNNGTANISFEKISYYFQHNEFIAFKQKYVTTMVIEVKYLNAKDQDWLIGNLARNAKPINFWNAYKMLHD